MDKVFVVICEIDLCGPRETRLIKSFSTEAKAEALANALNSALDSGPAALLEMDPNAKYHMSDRFDYTWETLSHEV